MVCAIFVALALVLIVVVGGFAGISIAGVCAGIAAVFAPNEKQRRRA